MLVYKVKWRITAMSENLNLERQNKPRKKLDVKSITSLAAVAALAMGTLAGCGQKNDVEAAPEPVEVTQSESVEVEEVEIAQSEPEVEEEIEVVPGTPIYETRFPDPIVDESLLEGFDDVGNEFKKFQHVQSFFEANGIPSLTAEELQGEGYAQRILNNWQQRSFLVADTFHAGYNDFAMTMAEYGLFGTEVQWIDPNFRDKKGDNVIFPHEEIGVIGLEHENGSSGEERVLPTFLFDKLLAHTETGDQSIFNSYTKAIMIEAGGVDPVFGTPSTNQMVIELVFMDGRGYIPRLMYYKQDSDINGSLGGNLGGYEYSIVNVPPEMQNLELY